MAQNAGGRLTDDSQTPTVEVTTRRQKRSDLISRYKCCKINFYVCW